MTEKEITDILTSIKKIVNAYYLHSETLSIEKLQSASDKLAVLGISLTEIVSSRAKTHLATYFDRKLLFAGSKVAIIDKGETAAKAEQLATLNVAEVKESEINSEIAFMEVNLKLRQLNILMSAIRQRISIAKKERENSDWMASQNNQK